MKAIIDRTAISYDTFGDRRRIGVLLIHGFPLTGDMWMPVVERLGGEFALVVPDLRGFGRSQLAPDDDPQMPISIARYADDMAALLDLMGEDRSMVVVGLSMGGYVAFELWRRSADRIRGLVLADTRADADSPVKQRERREAIDQVLAQGTRAVADAMAPKLFSPRAAPELRATWRARMAALDRHGVAAALRAMAGRADSTSTLSTITCPALVVVGEDDEVTPVAEARRMQQAIALSRLDVIAGAGHLPPIEQPDAFARSLREFIRSV